MEKPVDQSKANKNQAEETRASRKHAEEKPEGKRHAGSAKKKNRFLKPLLIVLFIALLGVFGYSAWHVTTTLHQYSESAHYYETTRSTAVSVTDPQQTVGTKTDNSAPEVKKLEVSPITVDFDVLRQSSSDIRGWLYCPDTKIDYPVVQAKDNAYYLYRFMDGTYNPSGSLFMDYRIAGDFSSKHTVIYGHHMGDGSMLASLVEYRSQEYYDEHPVMYLNTPDGNYRLELVSGFVTWYDSRLYTFDFVSRTEFEDWFALMRSYSDFESDVEVGIDDRIVTLSTCTYDYDNARYVVMAKLVPLAEG